MKQYKIINDKGYGTLKVSKGVDKGNVLIEPDESIVLGVIPAERHLFTIEEVEESMVVGTKKEVKKHGRS